MVKSLYLLAISTDYLVYSLFIKFPLVDISANMRSPLSFYKPTSLRPYTTPSPGRLWQLVIWDQSAIL